VTSNPSAAKRTYPIFSSLPIKDSSRKYTRKDDNYVDGRKSGRKGAKGNYLGRKKENSSLALDGRRYPAYL